RKRSRITRRRGGSCPRRDAEIAECVAGPGGVLREFEHSSPGSTSMMNVVSPGGIFARPAANGAGRGRLHPANPDSPGASHHITGALNTPRGLRSAGGQPLCALTTSASSASLCEPLSQHLPLSKSSRDPEHLV